MELEEAIKDIKVKVITSWYDPATFYFSEENRQQIDEVIQLLVKKDKMIELMIEKLEDYGADEAICDEISNTTYKHSICDGKCNKCIKQYFEKKAEESEKDVNE